MGLVKLSEPPVCPDGEWCPVCLMRAKQKQWEIYQDEIQAGYAKPGDTAVIWIPWPNALTVELRAGRWTGVCFEFAQLGLVRGLCWDDVAGVNPTVAPSGLAVADRPLPESLRRKKG